MCLWQDFVPCSLSHGRSVAYEIVETASCVTVRRDMSFGEVLCRQTLGPLNDSALLQAVLEQLHLMKLTTGTQRLCQCCLVSSASQRRIFNCRDYCTLQNLSLFLEYRRRKQTRDTWKKTGRISVNPDL